MSIGFPISLIAYYLTFADSPISQGMFDRKTKDIISTAFGLLMCFYSSQVQKVRIYAIGFSVSNIHLSIT